MGLYSDEEITIILRDLGESESLSILDMYKYYGVEETDNLKIKNSKSVLIQNRNILKRDQQIVKRDDERIDYFKGLDKFNLELFKEIANFKTERGKDKMKLKIMKIAFKEQKYSHVINLYLQLLSYTPEKSKEIKILSKVKEYMDSIDYKRLQFEKLSNELYPLDFYNKYEKKLDDWQKNVLDLINKKKSILVTAPTSCGKTWLSLYPAILGLSVLFVVPTDALVYQVASLITKFSENSPTLLTAEHCYGNNINLVIGTPEQIENKIVNLENKYDYVIFDEIHNLNHNNLGEYYERLLKLYSDSPILLLSATIGNPKDIINWLQKIKNTHIFLIKILKIFFENIAFP